MKVVLYSRFSKRKNSTKVPPNPGKEEDPAPKYASKIEGELLDPCSVLKPSIRFRPDAVNPYGYTMCYIYRFRRLYFIDDWTWTETGWIATMSIDVLGTYRAFILPSVQYVVRSTDHVNPYAIDMEAPTTTETKIVRVDIRDKNDGLVDECWQINTFDSGCYVVGITGYGGSYNAVGSVQYFVFTPSQFSTFAEGLFSNPDYLSIEGLSKGVGQAIVNPTEYITMCRWYPFTVDVLGYGGTYDNIHPSSRIQIGWWTLPVSCYVLTDPITTGRQTNERLMTARIFRHPQYDDKHKYLEAPPYSRYSLRFEPFGAVDIPANMIHNCTDLELQTTVDLTSGLASLQIWGEYNATEPMKPIYARLGVDIPLSQANAISIKDAIGAVTGAAAAVSTGGIAAGLAAGGIAAATALENQPRGSAGPVNGTFLNLREQPFLICEFIKVLPPDHWDRGYPAGLRTKLNNGKIPAGGAYQQTLNASVDINDVENIGINGSDAEREMIQQLMDGGFYIE